MLAYLQFFLRDSLIFDRKARSLLDLGKILHGGSEGDIRKFNIVAEYVIGF